MKTINDAQFVEVTVSNSCGVVAARGTAAIAGVSNGEISVDLYGEYGVLEAISIVAVKLARAISRDTEE